LNMSLPITQAQNLRGTQVMTGGGITDQRAFCASNSQGVDGGHPNRRTSQIL
jgi:hypothetical protein